MRRSGQWLHGFLDLCLLALLDEAEDYGFGLAQRLTGAGLGEVPGGTLYPALLRLQQQGWVQVTHRPSDSGPPRKYYRLTGDGRTALSRDAAGWRHFRDSLDTVLDGNGNGDGAAGDGSRSGARPGVRPGSEPGARR
ncbi:MAG: PadR family transcriptional regulator [Kineosporiaceae bacterium]